MLKRINKSTCHPEFISGSYEMLNQVQHDSQGGRSMVEMLGVLAIIGVLSVGGIYGYTTAMRSHRANEIVNATSMLFMIGLASNAGEGTQEMDLDSNMLPKGCTKIHYDGNKSSLKVYITDATDCATVKTKLGDKAGDCTAATGSGASGYNLTVTLGDGTTTADPCSQCLTASGDTCAGSNCSGCLYPNEYTGQAGQPCISASNCQRICENYCFQENDSMYSLCCAYGAGDGTCSRDF